MAKQSTESIVRRDLLPVDELRDEGYLQEVNRLFLHPLGLALSVRPCLTEDEVDRVLFPTPGDRQESEREHGENYVSGLVEGAYALVEHLRLDEPHVVGIHDGRDDPEGVVFSSLEESEDRNRALRVEYLWEDRARVRRDTLGFVVQPVAGVLSMRERLQEWISEIGPLDLADREDLASSLASDLGQ